MPQQANVTKRLKAGSKAVAAAPLPKSGKLLTKCGLLQPSFLTVNNLLWTHAPWHPRSHAARRVEELKLLSSVEKSGLLSQLEKQGLTLSKCVSELCKFDFLTGS